MIYLCFSSEFWVIFLIFCFMIPLRFVESFAYIRRLCIYTYIYTVYDYICICSLAITFSTRIGALWTYVCTQPCKLKCFNTWMQNR